MADTPQQRQLAGAKTVLALYSLRAATAHPGPMPSPAQPLAFARWLRRYRDWENLQFEDWQRATEAYAAALEDA